MTSTIEMSTSNISTVIEETNSASVSGHSVGYKLRTENSTFSDPVTNPGHTKNKVPRNPSKGESLREPRATRTLRRLKGFLVSIDSADPKTDQARVGFVESDNVIYYDLPARQIRESGITKPNQPFEMDEVETYDENGLLIVGYRYSPLAMPSDAYKETLPLDAERERKQTLIFREFGQP